MNYRILKLFGLILFIGLLSCEQNNEETEDLENQVTYDDEEYVLDKGCIEYYGENLFGLYLISSNLDFYTSENTLDSISGNGHSVYFEIYSDNVENISEGTYNFDYQESGDEFTFGFGKVSLNWNTSEKYSDDYDFASGSIEITKNEDVYTLSWSCVDEDEKIISGYYQGTLTYFQQKKESYFKIEDTTIEITQGCLDNNGPVDDVPNSSIAMILGLTNEGIIISSDNEGNVDYTGNAFLTQIVLYTSSETELDQIEFNYGSNFTYETGTFDGGYFNNWNSNTDTYQWKEIQSGTIKVNKVENDYEIILNCIDEANNTIEGYYKGELPIY